jgi:uncharacterized repeat protein (TIGR04042 family)
MPALNFELEWPDGEVMTCYSPSSMVQDIFREGESMTIVELAEACQRAFDGASRRVEERFGMPCAAAIRQKKFILSRLKRYAPNERVKILSMRQHES